MISDERNGETRYPSSLNKEATIEAIRAEKPDVVVVATGARPAAVEVPGADRKNVVKSWDVLTGNAKVARKSR